MKSIKLRPHQEKAVEKLSNGKILYGGTGSGKSITAMAYFVSKVCGGVYGDFGSMRTPMDIYIITTAKKRDNLDWDKEAIHFGITRDPDKSVAGIKMTVDSWNNIEKYVGVENAFFIFDEQRLVGSGAWAQTFIKIAKRNQWILLSATPGDTWLDYIPVFVANGWYKNRTHFKREHVVYNTFTKFPKVDRYVGTGKLVRLRNQILVHMPYESHTVRHVEDIKVNYNKELFDKVVKKRWHVYENRPLKGISEMFIVMRRVVNSDASRLEALDTLLSRHPRVIVFYNFDYELEMLRTLAQDSTKLFGRKNDELHEKSSTAGSESCEKTAVSESLTKIGSGSRSSLSATTTKKLSTGIGSVGSESKDEYTTRLKSKSSFAIAEWNGHKHEPVPTTESWLYLVQYTAGSEGWNCIDSNVICFFSLTYSWKQFHQAHGRIDRLNTLYTDLWYYILMSDSPIDRMIRTSLNNKKSFNESSVPLNALETT